MIYLLLALLARESTQSSISNPLLTDADIERAIPDYLDPKKTKNYYNSTPIRVEKIKVIDFHAKEHTASCGLDMKIRWVTDVGSSVYSSPVVFPVGHDGQRQIFLTTFYDNLELIGHDGFKLAGWPISFQDSSFQGSPILYDIDGDGKNDVGVVDKNGNMFW